MIKKIVIIMSIISVIIFLEACKESSTTEPPADIEVDESWFPANNGSSFKYSITVDSLGMQTSGNRNTLYSGFAVVGGVNYQVQSDTITFGAETNVNISYFRKTNSGIFYFLDTTGLASIIPDSLLQFITFDSELRLLFFPMTGSSNWPVFRLTFNQGAISFTPVEVRGMYDGKENLTIDPLFTNVESVRIRFTLSVRLDPFNPPTVYEAFGWLVDNVGFVKWQGNGTIVSAFAGSGIDFDDTTKVVTQTLTEFSIPE